MFVIYIVLVIVYFLSSSFTDFNLKEWKLRKVSVASGAGDNEQDESIQAISTNFTTGHNSSSADNEHDESIQVLSNTTDAIAAVKNKGTKRKLSKTAPKQLNVKVHNKSKQKKHHSGSVDLNKYIEDSKARSKALHTRTQTLMKKVNNFFRLIFLRNI